MPKINTRYNETYARLDAAFPGRYMLSRTQLAHFLGVSRTTVYNRFHGKLPARKYVTKDQAAKVLSEE